MINQEHIERLGKNLKQILDSEIALGNRVSETSKGWPNSRTVIVFLEKPFLAEYPIQDQGIIFREVNDPHYWKSEYYDRINDHVLACKF